MAFPDFSTVLAEARQALLVPACGRTWRVERVADLETLWAAIGDDDDPFLEDERLPYWVELWPSSLALADWLYAQRERIAGRTCLDMGCGLGLTAMVGAHLGARVVAMDYEWPAVCFARHNAVRNLASPAALPCVAQMDWRAPAVRRGAFSRLWAGDVMYEKRFIEPVAAFLDHALAPDGVAWVAEPDRNVYKEFREHMAGRGWHCEKRHTARREPIPPDPTRTVLTTVNIWELARP
ncbi:MAG: methyltransferase [Desulfovibrionaceae bacterium]